MWSYRKPEELSTERRKPVPLGTTKYKKVSKRNSYYSNILGEPYTSSALEVINPFGAWGR
jgi:hypothetical protein